MKILLLGRGGQVGWELCRSLMPLGIVTALDRTQCDLSDPDLIPGIIRENQPEIIVNAAAYTAVDKAEDEEELATVVNGTSVKVLAEEAQKMNALLVHYSTDYVFDGTKSGAYTESDTPNPVNAYGRSKLHGENAIIESGCEYLVFRTSWVYAARGNNFLKTMLRLARERNELRIVADQYGAPTWSRNIADVTSQVLHAVQQQRRTGGTRSSIYHLSAGGITTWHGFAAAVIEHARKHAASDSIITQRVLPIATEDYPLPARRPRNSQLDSGALARHYGLRMPEWHDAVEMCIDECLDAT